MGLTKRLLFLDDIRYPIEAYHYTKQDIFLRNDWYIVGITNSLSKEFWKTAYRI